MITKSLAPWVRNGLASVLALTLVLSALVSPVAAGEASPRQIAQLVDSALIEAMRNAKTLGYAGRYETLDPVLRQSFDFPFMARVAVGRYWRKLADSEKQALVEAFARLSVATFAGRFKGYSGESFEIKGEEAQPRGAVLVVNHLIKSNGEPIAINYLMRQSKKSKSWRIVDVFLDAKYSELAVKRSEYTAVLARDGIEGLLNIMQSKIDGFTSRSPS